MFKYLLNCCIYCYTEDNRCYALYNTELMSENIEEVEKLFDEFSGEIYENGEYIPNRACIKYSVVLAELDEKEDVHILQEKYQIIDLHEYFNNFWKLSSKLNLCEC